ncbi:MAG: hypothetical protein ABFE08_14085 [Armatimonadia bacterium]
MRFISPLEVTDHLPTGEEWRKAGLHLTVDEQADAIYVDTYFSVWSDGMVIQKMPNRMRETNVSFDASVLVRQYLLKRDRLDDDELAMLELLLMVDTYRVTLLGREDVADWRRDDWGGNRVPIRQIFRLDCKMTNTPEMALWVRRDTYNWGDRRKRRILNVWIEKPSLRLYEYQPQPWDTEHLWD